MGSAGILEKVGRAAGMAMMDRDGFFPGDGLKGYSNVGVDTEFFVMWSGWGDSFTAEPQRARRDAEFGLGFRPFFI